MLSHLARFRFSLLTLLLAVAWSAVVVWLNVEPQMPPWRYLANYGWPFVYAWEIQELQVAHRFQPSVMHSYWALTGDVAIGVLLVAALTCGSSEMLRRVAARLRRRPVLLLQEGQSQDSHANKSTPPASSAG